MKISEIPDFGSCVSASCIYTGRGCERCFYYRHRLGIVLKAEGHKPSARLGSLYHRLKHLGPDGVEVVRLEVVAEQKELMKQIAAGDDLVGDLARTATAMTDLYNKALVMAQIYWKNYPIPDYLESISNEELVEVDIDVPLFDGRNIVVRVKSRLDKMIRDTRNNDLWIRDEKTTGRSLASVYTGYHFSVQCRLYRVVGSEVLDQPVKGFILDVTKTPGIKLSAKDNKNAAARKITPAKAYLQRVEDWYKDQKEPGMDSRAIMFNEPVLPDELIRDLLFANDLLNRPMIPESFRRDTTTKYCMRYEKVCEYYDLCNTSQAGWPGLIENKYKIREKQTK